MKKILITSTIVMSGLFSSQTVDIKPNLLGVSLGDNLSEWKSKLLFEGSKGSYSKYHFTKSSYTSIFGYPIEDIAVIFDSRQQVTAIFVVLKDFPYTGWNATEFTDIKENLEQIFGRVTDFYKVNDSGNVDWYWDGSRNYLSCSYKFKGSFSSSNVEIGLVTKSFMSGF
ncbi:MAG: hypothetical protein E6Q35_07000 [Chryseobacterium cucumeris]|nr:MAG: hypothetical protein E6Q35_07000 [Chryseobacterium cucumeris]